MALDFPNSPNINDTFGRWRWDGVKWARAGAADVISQIFIGPLPPDNPAIGNLWWDTTIGQLFIWYDDGTSSQWVGIGVGGAPVGAGGGLIVGPTPPSNPLPNTMWFDGSTGQLYIWFNDGTSQQWVAISATPGEAGAVGPVGPAGPIGPMGPMGALTHAFNAIPAQITFPANTITDGPMVDVGNVGTWFATGAVSVGAASAANLAARLWDGTTIIANSIGVNGSANWPTVLSVSGFITNPAGPLRISAACMGTTAYMYANYQVTGGMGTTADDNRQSHISAIRIA
ncbi:MAG: hypothetical protein C5B54_04135 [Acidobacteria bacterium]|nr:MAG: hypothetical protein C5B54_04135 [Acidobacteriota bacterium]